jgi:transposase
MIGGRTLNTDAYVSDGLETLKRHRPDVPTVETVLAQVKPANKTNDPDSSNNVPDSSVIRPDNIWD